MSKLGNLYDELRERSNILKNGVITESNKTRMNELNLVIVRVQQLLLTPDFLPSKKILTDKYLMSLGFKRERIWSKHQANFTLKYTLDGYDSDIDLIATYPSPSLSSVDEQINNGVSDVEHLIDVCQPSYGVWFGSNHATSIHYECDLYNLFKALKLDESSIKYRKGKLYNKALTDSEIDVLIIENSFK